MALSTPDSVTLEIVLSIPWLEEHILYRIPVIQMFYITVWSNRSTNAFLPDPKEAVLTNSGSLDAPFIEYPHIDDAPHLTHHRIQ